MIWRRVKNLWELSNFKITEFDNKLVVTKKDDNKLVVAFPETPRLAQVIKRTDPIKEFLTEDKQNG